MPGSYLLQIIFLLTFVHIEAKKPPGYVEPPKEHDPNPPKYEYGYKIVDETGKGQEKSEKRDGIYAQGRYSVQNSDSSQDVQYFADDWGYHPVVEYSSVGPHSRSKTKFALGEEAVKQLKDKENGLPTTELPKSAEPPRDSPNQVAVQQPQQQVTLTQPQQTNQNDGDSGKKPQDLQNSEQQLVTPIQPVAIDPGQPQEPQQVLIQQPQQVYVQQQPQQLLVQQPQQILVQQQQDKPQQQLLFEQPQFLVDSQSRPVLLEGEQYTESQRQIFNQQQPENNVVFLSKGQQNSGLTNLLPNQGVLFENRIIHTKPSETKRPVSEAPVLLEKSDTVGKSSLEFGAKLSVYSPSKLIESTKDLVTGQDVLNINNVANVGSNIETSTVQSFLRNYVTPIINNPATNININHPTITYSTTEATPATQISLNAQPIVAAEPNENVISSTTERTDYASSTVATISDATCEHDGASTVLVTPRPVGSQFLAPITAGVQLETAEQKSEEAQQLQQVQQKENVLIEVQKSLPYYLGKYEYPTSYAQAYSQGSNDSVESKANEDIELGKTLIMFPGDLRHTGHQTLIHHPSPAAVERKQNVVDITSNHLTSQQLPEEEIKQAFADQQQIQGEQIAQYVEHSQQPIIQDQQLQYILKNALSSQSTAQVDVQRSQSHQLQDGFSTRIVHTPYSIPLPYEVPYPIVKQVQVPLTIQRVVEKPVHITQYVEKPIPVPRPYPVEKIIEKPVHIPVQVTKYVDRPYPVEVRVPIPQPYPVEKVVEKIVRQPYPVEVKIPVQVPVEKIIEKKVHIPQYIEKPVPVEKIVEKPVAHYVDRPYPVEVKVPVPVPTAYLFPVAIQKSYNTKQNVQLGVPIQVVPTQQVTSEQYTQQSQQLGYYYPNPYAYAPQVNQYLPPKQEVKFTKAYLPPKVPYTPPRFTNEYLPPVQHHDCDNQGQHSQNQKYVIKNDDYIGLLPPRANLKSLKKFRSARSNSFDESSVRMEYGFMPPLIPSLEIDEHGQPIEKDK